MTILKYPDTGSAIPATPTVAGIVLGETNTVTGNVFLGPGAGANESGSNKLYIANSNTSSPLIYGNFSQGFVTVNGGLNVTGTLSASNGYVTINGTTVNLGGSINIIALPAQDSTTAGKYLISNGSTASWQEPVIHPMFIIGGV